MDKNVHKLHFLVRLECIVYRLLCMSLSWVLDGDQVVWNVDGSLIGILPLSPGQKLCIVLTEEVEHAEPGHVVEQNVL